MSLSFFKSIKMKKRIFLVGREAGFQCVQLEGQVKCGSYQPGDDTCDHRSNWNAIQIDGNWHLVNPFWVCRCVVGRKTGGWVKLEEGGRAVVQRTENAVGTMRNTFKEYYFMTNPEELGYMCYPDDPKWQLVENPITQTEFTKLPYLFPPFFGLGMKLVSENSCHLVTVKGKLTLKVEAPAKNANTLEMWYELYIRDTSDNDLAMLTPENLPKLVAMIRCGERWRFELQCPVEGTYKLILYGGLHKDILMRLAEFRIDCKERVSNCIPLPLNPGRTGFGPGPVTEYAGLTFPSHRNGKYPIRKKTPLHFEFLLDGEVKKEESTFKSTLHFMESENGNLVAKSSTHCSDIVISSRKLKLTVNVQIDGEYTLAIAKHQQNNTAENVCYYLLSSSMIAPGEVI